MSSVCLQKDQFNNLIQDSYGDREFRGDYDGSNNLIYAGFATLGSDESTLVWQIKQLTYSGTNLTSVKWPQYNNRASSDYSFSWTNRASYTYS